MPGYPAGPSRFSDDAFLLATWNFSQIFAHMTRICEKSQFLLSTSGTSLSECCGYYNIACLFLHEGLSSKIDTYIRHFLLLTHKSPLWRTYESNDKTEGTGSAPTSPPAHAEPERCGRLSLPDRQKHTERAARGGSLRGLSFDPRTTDRCFQRRRSVGQCLEAVGCAARHSCTRET
jgi:hypothetical protein